MCMYYVNEDTGANLVGVRSDPSMTYFFTVTLMNPDPLSYYASLQYESTIVSEELLFTGSAAAFTCV